ncbi:MAG: hypothetical protein ACE5GW_13295, partial [Planctomycetota bacterium]
SLLVPALEAHHAAIRETRGKARVVGCRVRLTVATHRYRQLEEALARDPTRELIVPHDGVIYFIDKITNAARPARDLRLIARGDDPPALIARDLLLLEEGANGGEEGAERDERDSALELLEEARRRLEQATEPARFLDIGRRELGLDEVREALLHAGRIALEEVLATGEGSR